MTPTDLQALKNRIKTTIYHAVHEMHHPAELSEKSQDLTDIYYVDQRLIRIDYYKNLRYVDESINYFEIGCAVQTLGLTDEHNWPRFPFLKKQDRQIATRIYQVFQYFPQALLHLRVIAPTDWKRMSTEHMNEIFVFAHSLAFSYSDDKENSPSE